MKWLKWEMIVYRLVRMIILQSFKFIIIPSIKMIRKEMRISIIRLSTRLIVVSKRRKKRNTRRPNSWRTFGRSDNLRPIIRECYTPLPTTRHNCRRFWPYAPIIGRKVGCYAFAPFTHYYVGNCVTIVGNCVTFADNGWQWLTIADNGWQWLTIADNGWRLQAMVDDCWRLQAMVDDCGWPLSPPLY